MTSSQHRILFVGDSAWSEFHEPLRWLGEHSQLTTASSMAEAADRQRSFATASIVVIGQRRPGEFSQRQIESLYAAAPLARLVCLLGGWCQGESRSGWPWSGVPRIYWHQWPGRFPRAFGVGRDGGEPARLLPRTATETDALLYPKTPIPRAGGPPATSVGLAAIWAEQLFAYEPLAEACQARGYATAWWANLPGNRVHGADVLIWNCERWDALEQQRIEQLGKSPHCPPILLLMGWPRREDIDAARSMGVIEVLSKPLMSDDLFDRLDHIRRSKRNQKAA